MAVCSYAFEFWLVLKLAHSTKTVQTKFLDKHFVVSREFVEKDYNKASRNNTLVTGSY